MNKTMIEKFKKAWVLVDENESIINNKFYDTKHSATKVASDAVKVCSCTIYFYINFK